MVDCLSQTLHAKAKVDCFCGQPKEQNTWTIWMNALFLPHALFLALSGSIPYTYNQLFLWSCAFEKVIPFLSAYSNSSYFSVHFNISLHELSRACNSLPHYCNSSISISTQSLSVCGVVLRPQRMVCGGDAPQTAPLPCPHPHHHQEPRQGRLHPHWWYVQDHCRMNFTAKCKLEASPQHLRGSGWS